MLNAKRRKNEKTEDMLNNAWYDKVDSDATPDDVFWNEMERQRAIAGIEAPVGPMEDPLSALSSNIGQSQSAQTDSPKKGSGTSKWAALDGAGGVASTTATSTTMTSAAAGAFPGNVPTARTLAEEKSSDAVLASFSAFAVNDNWLDEEYIEEMKMMEEEANFDLEDQDAILEKQIEEWEKVDDDGERFDVDLSSLRSLRTVEPWDTYRPDGQVVDEDDFESGVIKIDQVKARSELAKEFLIEDFDNNVEEQQHAAEEEIQHLNQLKKIKLQSTRLEKARKSPNAKAFFSRAPNEIEGFERMWASAIDNACLPNLNGSFRNLGVEFADNFGDWENGCDEDAFQTIEDIASYKARKVYEVTGLPTIASRTSFEIEPARVMDKMTPMNRGFQNNRVTSGYRFNDVADHVDYLMEALKLFSEPTRVTRFRSCFCFYDGEMEIFDYGELDCDIYFCNSMRTYIPMSSGISEIGKTLQLTYGFEFQGWLRKRVREAMQGSDDKVSRKLRDRVLKDGRVLPNDIIDVSAFMDSLVDVNLMDECAKELSKRFETNKPTKILTVATTGLVLAIPMARYLQIPVVYARKERSVVMSDAYIAGYSSKTVGKNRELLVSKKHLHDDDRILIVDDFLSSGASQEALLRIVSDSGAKAVGVGILLEKSYDAGRQSLSGYNIPIESLVKVASVSDGIITLEEEEGYSAVR